MFSSRLKSLRKESNKTQEDMAKLLSIRRSTYGEYERGIITPPLDKMKILADYFGVSVDYMAGHTNVKTHASETSEIDVSRQLNVILDYLSDNQSALTFDGDILDVDSRELLKTSIENSLKMTKIMKGKNS